MAEKTVAIRLKTVGGEDSRRDVMAFADSGDAAAKRFAKSWVAADEQMEAMAARREQAQAKLNAIMPTTPTQATAQGVAATGYDGASARNSAASIKDGLVENAALDAKAKALLDILEPLRAAQQRYNVAIAEASRLHDTGRISIDQFIAAEAREAAMLERVSGVARTAEAAEAALMAGRERIHGAPDTIMVGKSAAESAAAMRELMSAEEALQQRVDALRASIDPAEAAQQRFNLQMAEARALVSQGAISLDEYCAKLRIEQAELNAGSGALARHGAGFGSMGIAGMEAEHVVRAFSDSVAAGQSPLRAMSMELPRVSEAMMFWSQTSGQTEGAMGKLAAFMGGPWGLGISAGMAVLGPLVAKLFEGEDASDKLKQKTMALEDALRREASATQAAKQALDDYNAKQDEARKNDSLAIDNQLRLADARLKDALATREQTRAQLAQALLQENQAHQSALDQQRLGKNDAATFAAQYADGRTVALQALLGGEKTDIARLQQTQRDVMIQDARRGAAEAVDPVKKLNDQYDQMRDKAIRAASANTALAGSLRATLSQIEQQRKAAVDAEREREKDHSSGGAAKKSDRDAAAAAREQDRDLVSVQNQFDPAAKAAREYADALEEIRKAHLEPATAGRYATAAKDAWVQARASAFTLGRVEDMRPAYDANSKADEQGQKDLEKRDAFVTKMKTDQANALEEARAELGLIRLSDTAREGQIAKLELIQQLKEGNAQLDSDDAKGILATGEALAQIAVEQKEHEANWKEATHAGTQFIDDVLDPSKWSRWGDVAKNVLNDIEQEMIKLAILNPIKNALLGEQNPGLGGVLGSLLHGSGGGAASTPDGFAIDGFTPHNASGTENWSGGRTWVNENGPEIADLPSGTRIYPAALSRQMVANDNRGGDTHVHQNFENNFAGGAATQKDVQQMGQIAYAQALAAVRDANRRAPGR